MEFLHMAILHLLTNVCLVIFLCLLLIFLFKFFFKKSYTTKRHHYKIKKAKEIIEKLSTFEGEFKNAKIIAYLRKIDPYVFEELLLSAFENKGYKIKRNASYSADYNLQKTDASLLFVRGVRMDSIKALRMTLTCKERSIRNWARQSVISH